jgi:opacity protein-like surface antigen
MKKYLTISLILVFTFLLIDTSQSQVRTTTRVKTPLSYWSISPFGGFNLPIGTFADNYKASGVAGLDIDYRVNHETSIFLSFAYNFLRTKDPDGPKSSYISYTVGPRYHFTHPRLNSSIFLEGGVGGYTFNSDAYTINDPTVGPIPVEKVSDTRVGVNAGIGAELNLSPRLDIFVRSKYHSIFRTGGTSSFIGTDGGFKIRLN